MTASVPVVVAMAVLFAAGVYLLLDRSVTRVIIGVLLIGNATNLLLLVLAGPPGAAPIVRGGAGSSDPLPQVLILTAIVITFAVSAFLLALVYRSWRLAREDELQPDADDLAVAEREAPEPEEAEPDERSEFADERSDEEVLP